MIQYQRNQEPEQDEKAIKSPGRISSSSEEENEDFGLNNLHFKTPNEMNEEERKREINEEEAERFYLQGLDILQNFRLDSGSAFKRRVR